MKAFNPIILVAVVVCCVLAGPASGVTNIELQLVHPELYFVNQDPCHAVEFFTPPPPGGKDNYHQGDPEPVSLCIEATRRILWRVEILANASYNDFDWRVVKAGLELTYGVKIGEQCCCTIVGQPKGPANYWATVNCFSGYTREIYRVDQDGKIAVISVLKPADGMVPVTVALRHANGGNQEPEPATHGLCASARFLPFNGNACDRRGGKPNYEDQPILTDPDVPVTWGRIKALYE